MRVMLATRSHHQVSDQSPSLTLWGIALPVVLSLGVAMAIARWLHAVPYDDPFITYRYAANLRDGVGLVFNPGEPVFSVTTPLMALLLGALGFLVPTAEIATLGYWLSLAAQVVAGMLASLICWQNGERAAALLAPFSLMLAPTLINSVGQEISLLLALGLLSFFLWQRGRARLAATALGFLALTRPDGAILVVVLVLAEWHRSFAPRRLVVPGLLFVAIVAPWYLYAWFTYGSPFPFSLTAKTAAVQTGWWQPTGPGLWEWFQWTLRQTPYAIGLSAFALAYAVRRARWALLLLAWPAIQLLGYTVIGVAFAYWYAAPLHGILGLFSALGAGAAVRLASQAGRRWLPVGLTLFVAASLAVIMQNVQYVRAFGQNVPDPKMRQYEVVGTWLRQHTGRDRLIGALEMGRLGYFSRRPMFDFVGLVTPPVVEHLRRRDLMWSVTTYRPDYLVTIPPDRWLLDDAWFQSTYAPLERFADPRVYDGQPITVFLRSVGTPPAEQPFHALTHRFDDRIALTGYRILAPAGDVPDRITVVLHWQAIGPIEKDFTAFVHAIDAEGKLVAQADGQPLGGRYPTSRWTEGAIVLDPREIVVPRGARPVKLQVGWYLLETMQRLPGRNEAGQPEEAAIIPIPPP